MIQIQDIIWQSYACFFQNPEFDHSIPSKQIINQKQKLKNFKEKDTIENATVVTKFVKFLELPT